MIDHFWPDFMAGANRSLHKWEPLRRMSKYSILIFARQATKFWFILKFNVSNNAYARCQNVRRGSWVDMETRQLETHLKLWITSTARLSPSANVISDSWLFSIKYTVLYLLSWMLLLKIFRNIPFCDCITTISRGGLADFETKGESWVLV